MTFQHSLSVSRLVTHLRRSQLIQWQKRAISICSSSKFDKTLNNHQTINDKLFSSQIVVPNNLSQSIIGRRNFSTSFRLLDAAEVASVATDTSKEATISNLIELIPDKPLPIVEGITNLVEPTFKSLGLASYWPPGRAQALLEWIHVSGDFPWWGTILIAGGIIRLMIVPALILSQRHKAYLNQCLPEVNKYQSLISKAKKRGDTMEVNHYSMKLQAVMKKSGAKTKYIFGPLVLQAPIFMSFFMGLRSMCHLPVESLTTGGLFWFTDLTVADPYYALPVMASGVILMQILIGADGTSTQNLGPIGRKLIYLFPVTFLPFSIFFPSAITLYMVLSSLISVSQAKILNSSYTRKLLNIPEPIVWQKENTDQRGFFEALRQIKDDISNSSNSETIDRRDVDERSFKEAGVGKVKRTYKFNPTMAKYKKND